MIRFLAVALVAAFSVTAHARSFSDIREAIYAHPLKKLPDYPGVSALDFAKAFLVERGEIVDRSWGTLRQEDDIRLPRPKLLHPRGVCAEARWKITENSPLTGLFAKGTVVPAIIRFSSGTQESRLSSNTRRMFGLALKLFPTHDIHKDVVTKNVFMLDNFGFEGSRRPFYLQPKYNDEATFFTNFAPPRSRLGKLANSFFERFDFNPEHRPVYALAGTDQEGRKVEKPVTPFEINLVPRAPFLGLDKPDDDFRSELLRYRAGEMRFLIVVPGRWADGMKDRLLGELSVGEPVVSEFCDLDLHFHHHPNNRNIGD